MIRLRRLRAIPLLCAAVALAASGCATTPRSRGLRALVDGRPGVAPALAGLAVVVVDHDGERRAEAYGRAVIDAADPSRERAMSVDAPVRIASVSKLVMTIGVMRLVEQGVLDLDRDVSDYLGWRLRNPAFADRPVTLRLLLSHRSSLVDDGGYFFPLGAKIAEAIGSASWNTKHPPAGVFAYANLNFGVIATVMEKATGERFDRLNRRLVTEPLGIDACFNWSGCSDAAVARAAALYRKSSDEDRWVPTQAWVPQIDDLRGGRPTCLVRLPSPQASCDLDSYRPGDNGSLFSPQGGLRISVRDLGRVAGLLLRGGEIDGARLLKPETVRMMLAPVWRVGDAPAGENYGGLMRCYGLSVQCLVGVPGEGDQPLDRPVRWLGHMGEAYGLWSGIWIDPAAGRAYVHAVTGTADDPAKYPGRRSQFRAFEEAILEEVAR
jgi:CubicO group peptidase (beta-lactamase class C family)